MSQVGCSSTVHEKAKNMLKPDVIEEITTLVRMGIYDKTQLVHILCEEKYEPGELEPTAVAAVIDDEWTKWESQKTTWPAVTDCDRLDSAFVAIGKHAIIALHNAGYTQNDGYELFLDAYDSISPKSSIIGYCYYHGQDLERAVRGEGLYIAFGPVDPSEEESKGPKIGNFVRDELIRAGLNVDWNGTFASRIYLPSLAWQRR